MILNSFKSIFLSTIFISIAYALSAQTYVGGGMPIPDHGAAINIPLNVSGLDSAQINSNYGLETVCINIHHTADRDLAIYLMSPDGTSVELTSGIGGTGDDYENTCFNMDATTLITTGVPPYTGSYVPRHSIGVVNNGSNGNGTWRLILIDYISGDTGSVIDWHLTFGYHPSPPVSVSIGACDDYHPAACVCPDSAASCWLKPDMFIASSMLTDTLLWRRESFGRLQVTNSCANVGFGPMELIGTGLWFCGDSLVSGPGLCPDSSFRKQQVKQRIYIKQEHLAYFDFVDTIVGMMQFHSALGHNHLHIDDWAKNTIRIRGPESDPSLWPIIAAGNKVSFCLYDHLACGTSFRNCEKDSNMFLYADIHNNGLGAGYAVCGTSVQGISVGYSDVYDWTLEGQDILFDTLCNGNYYLVSEIDPTHRFVDQDRSNNVTIVPLVLNHQMPNCCKANFRIDTLSFAENRYRFVDLTTPIPDRWYWDFGNGYTDSTQFPIVDFNDSTSFHVRLETFNNSACSDSASRNILIHKDYSDTCHFALIIHPDIWSAEITLIDSNSVSSMTIRFLGSSYMDTLSPFRFVVHNFCMSGGLCYDTLILDVSDIYGCRRIDTIGFYTIPEGIDELNTYDHVQVFPNPSTDQTMLSFNIRQAMDVSIQLLDCLGRRVVQVNEQTKHIVGEYHYPIALPNKGIYFLKCKFGNREQTFKIVSY